VSPGITASDPLSSTCWRVVGASVQGVGHEKAGVECQDAHGWAPLPHGIALCVADGAGSAPDSALGAECACRAALLAVEANPPGPDLADAGAVLTEAVRRARNAVAGEALQKGVEERDLATTLILAIVTQTGAAAIQIGDGAVVLNPHESPVFALTRPAHDEYVNQTCFLTDPEALTAPQTATWRGQVRDLALFSDGLELLALRMPHGEPHAPFFAPLFRFVRAAADSAAANEELRGFLRSPRIASRTDDDLTLLLAALD
jgi:hypothetical protein